MLTLEQAQVVRKVLKRFNDSETLPWTDLDSSMEFLAYLNDEQLAIESEVVLDKHLALNARCDIDHPPEQCFIPTVLRAVNYILEDFKKSEKLPKLSRYVLEYYLSLSQTGMILHD